MKRVLSIHGKTFMRYILFILTVFLFLGCTPKDTGPLNFNGYTALKVRSLWQLCYQAHLQNVRPINPAYFSLQCDCVVDQTMKDHHADNLDKVTNIQDYFTKVNLECSEKVKAKYFKQQDVI